MHFNPTCFNFIIRLLSSGNLTCHFDHILATEGSRPLPSSAAISGLMTNCIIPSRSRKSIKINTVTASTHLSTEGWFLSNVFLANVQPMERFIVFLLSKLIFFLLFYHKPVRCFFEVFQKNSSFIQLLSVGTFSCLASSSYKVGVRFSSDKLFQNAHDSCQDSNIGAKPRKKSL